MREHDGSTPKPAVLFPPMAAKKKSAKKKPITAAARRKVPAAKMGLPDLGKYPVNTKGRAAAAKGRVSEALGKGNVTATQAKKVVAKADAELGKPKQGSKRKPFMAMIGAAKKAGGGKLPKPTKASKTKNPAITYEMDAKERKAARAKTRKPSRKR